MFNNILISITAFMCCSVFGQDFLEQFAEGKNLPTKKETTQPVEKKIKDIRGIIIEAIRLKQANADRQAEMLYLKKQRSNKKLKRAAREKAHQHYVKLKQEFDSNHGQYDMLHEKIKTARLHQKEEFESVTTELDQLGIKKYVDAQSKYALYLQTLDVKFSNKAINNDNINHYLVLVDGLIRSRVEVFQARRFGCALNSFISPQDIPFIVCEDVLQLMALYDDLRQLLAQRLQQRKTKITKSNAQHTKKWVTMLRQCYSHWRSEASRYSRLKYIIEKEKNRLADRATQQRWIKQAIATFNAGLAKGEAQVPLLKRKLVDAQRNNKTARANQALSELYKQEADNLFVKQLIKQLKRYLN